MKQITQLAALCLALITAGCDAVNSEPPDFQTMRESHTLGAVKEFKVELKYPIGRLEVTRIADENLFSFDLQYDRRRFDPKFHFDDGDRASMSLDLDGRSTVGAGSGGDNDLTVRLSDKVPLDLDITTGVSESHMEMTSLQVQRLHLQGGVGKTEVTFDKPTPTPMQSLDVESGVGELVVHGLGNTHVSHVELQGGVGHTELDFTGELGMTNSEASVKVGVGSIRLIIPRDADVEIEGQGSFLSNISAPSFEHHDRTYTHHVDGGPRIHITVESGIGSVEVELI